jgi:chaperone modulatory protein CbpM
MREDLTAVGVWLVEPHTLDIEEFARACGTDQAFIGQLIDEGLLQPAVLQPHRRFGGEELARVRRIRRLQRDFEANLQSVAVMLDLLDEIDRLRTALARAGLPLP